jgi:predicted nucleic acid-binding protein
LERVSPYTKWLDPVFESLYNGEREAVISVITESEVLVRPLRQGDGPAVERATVLFAEASISLLNVDREIAIKAARLRADLNLKLPDALIIATSIVTGCDAIVGNDKRCSTRVTEIPYIYLDEVVSG